MTIARTYSLTAKEGAAAEMADALTALGRTLQSLAGLEGVDLLQDMDRPDRFLFIERWESVEAHKGGAAGLPKNALAAVMAASGERPLAWYAKCLDLT